MKTVLENYSSLISDQKNTEGVTSEIIGENPISFQNKRTITEAREAPDLHILRTRMLP
jgi:hypothetical protein